MTNAFTHSEMSVRFAGSRGVATLTGAFSQNATGTLEIQTDDVSLRLGSATPAGLHYEHYRRQADAFLDAVTGPQPGTSLILDAAEDALVIGAIAASVRSGRAENVSYSETEARRVRTGR